MLNIKLWLKVRYLKLSNAYFKICNSCISCIMQEKLWSALITSTIYRNRNSYKNLKFLKLPIKIK